MITKMNKRRAFLFGSVVILIQMVISNLLYMNPLVISINKRFEGHTSLKSFEFIGGLGNWIVVTMIFGIILMVFWIILYQHLYQRIPGKGWSKGLIFGFVLSLVKAVPEAFNQWMVINYPTPLIIIQLINTTIGLSIFGALLGFFFSRFKVIVEE